jgi:hypothetical protein
LNILFKFFLRDSFGFIGCEALVINGFAEIGEGFFHKN